ncbi:MAG: hypothetical protein KDJ19_08745 [Hyphomicrobiaceae bacterium]|nr:hypothetical protein [Hyphomicrobiaceae bacterium]MCC0023164.1 hypothetical protein [Hyphomicrobiaceae bacterium]
MTGRSILLRNAAVPAIRTAISVLGLSIVSACSTAGDFGRIEGDVAALAYQPADTTAGLASSLAISDEERDFQSRLQRFMNMDQGSGWFADVTRKLRISTGKQPTEQDYFIWLRDDYSGSIAGAYGRIGNDVQTDLLTLPGLFTSICGVERVDQQRHIAAGQIPTTPPETLAGLEERRMQNQQDIADFGRVLHFRYNSYSYALEQMLVEAPSESARYVDAKLSELAEYLGRSENNAYCDAQIRAEAPRSRFAGPIEQASAGQNMPVAL